ncbi:hypothetical protein LNP25_07925 [Klebsiella variicola subsp. variicola]|nr:hypothetical protein [Klebsiella variicola subsp. variicola]
MSHNDTIVARATPPGRGGVGILRISGLKARDVAQAVLGKLPKPRYADYLPFNDVDGTPLDQGIALWFPGPNSFTGEDVLELQGHGGPVIPRSAAQTYSDVARRTHRQAGRVFRARVPQRQARPGAGRSHRRPHRRQFRTGGALGVELLARGLLRAG